MDLTEKKLTKNIKNWVKIIKKVFKNIKNAIKKLKSSILKTIDKYF
jgi:hypothetical protein